MKKLLFLVLVLLTVACTGCVEKKIATQNAFYSTQSPSITIKFPENVQYVGEQSGTKDHIRSKRYYFADEDKTHAADRLSFIEIQSIDTGYYWYPKYLPVGSGPFTNIYTKNVEGEDYYCRTLITNSNIDPYAEFYKNHEITIPDTLEVMVCTKKISDRKKAMFAYMRKADLSEIRTIFDFERFDTRTLTSEQIHYFNDLDKELSSELIARKFQEGDLQ